MVQAVQVKIVNGPQHPIHIGTLAFDHVGVDCKSKRVINQASMPQTQCTRASLGHTSTIGIHAISKVKQKYYL